MKDFLNPISNPEREKRQVEPWLAWNADFWLIMSNNKPSELAGLAGVERGWKVCLLRLTEFFLNGILRETQGYVIDTCHMFSTFYVGARDILVTFDDACPTSSVRHSWWVYYGMHSYVIHNQGISLCTAHQLSYALSHQVQTIVELPCHNSITNVFIKPWHMCKGYCVYLSVTILAASYIPGLCVQAYNFLNVDLSVDFTEYISFVIYLPRWSTTWCNLIISWSYMYAYSAHSCGYSSSGPGETRQGSTLISYIIILYIYYIVYYYPVASFRQLPWLLLAGAFALFYTTSISHWLDH